jgi:two-component system, OmpR family, response regulator ChvI
MASRPRLVLVDDDPVFLRLLSANLEEAGYAPVAYSDPQAGFAALRHDRPAACLFDWDMPGMDGLALLRALREEGARFPVLFLTGHATPMFEEAALAAGAVDFIDKSRGPAIVLHRIALALSRADGPVRAEDEEVALGDVTLREGSKRVLWRGEEVALSRGEYEIVALLVRRAGRDVPYRALYDALHGDGFHAGQGEDGYRANVRAMIKRIRRKFAEIDPDFDALGTYPGFGYRWQAGAP